MTTQTVLTAFNTLLTREIKRILRIWVQTLMPPAISMGLYFIIFGNLIGSQITGIGDFTYMQFLAPGLIMMAVITNSYGNVVSSFYGARFQHFIEEILVSPTPLTIMLLAYICGGIIRGILVAGIVTLISLIFTHLTIHSYLITFSTIFLCAFLFSLAGFTNALYAKSFDDITLVPSFILTPLTYLGGVFYSINLLPPFWKTLSQFNPILYMVNTFRYGILGVSDINIYFSYTMIVSSCLVLFGINWWLLQKGYGIRQ
jgi:ABC-2 type transport system permease protein